VDNRSNGQEKKGAWAGGAARRRAIPAAAASRSWPISVIWAPSCTRSGPGEGSRYRGSYRTSKTTNRGRVEALHGGGRHGVTGERHGAVLARVWAALHTVPHQRDTRKLPRALVTGHWAQGRAAGGEELFLTAVHWQAAVRLLQEARGSKD
jgi:hypothetical protein